MQAHQCQGPAPVSGSSGGGGGAPPAGGAPPCTAQQAQAEEQPQAGEQPQAAAGGAEQPPAADAGSGQSSQQTHPPPKPASTAAAAAAQARRLRRFARLCMSLFGPAVLLMSKTELRAASAAQIAAALYASLGGEEVLGDLLVGACALLAHCALLAGLPALPACSRGARTPMRLQSLPPRTLRLRSPAQP